MGRQMDSSWYEDGIRRVKVDDSEGVSEGDEVTFVCRYLRDDPELTMTVTGLGDEHSDGGRYVYGRIDWHGFGESLQEMIPGDELTDEMVENVRSSLKRDVLDFKGDEIDQVISGLCG